MDECSGSNAIASARGCTCETFAFTSGIWARLYLLGSASPRSRASSTSASLQDSRPSPESGSS